MRELCEYVVNLNSATGEVRMCRRLARVVLKCVDLSFDGPDREARFDWMVCNLHARQLEEDYKALGFTIESEEPLEG